MATLTGASFSLGVFPPRNGQISAEKSLESSLRTFLDFQCTAPPPFVGGMCVVFLYIRTPKLPGEEAIDCPYAAVIAVNRDEGYTRDTARLHWWPQDVREDPRECKRDWQILAGRDGEGGGTWCGVSRDGRFAVLTNVAEATPQFKPGEAPSRGELPVAFLEEKHPRRPPARWLRDLAQVKDKYNGFNLIVGDSRTGEFAYITNRNGDESKQTIVRLDSDSSGGIRCASGYIHGLSNAGLNTRWPKVTCGMDRMRCEMERVVGSGVFIEDGVEKRLFKLSAARSALPSRMITQVLQNPGEWDVYGSKGWFARSYWGDGHEVDPPLPLNVSERAFVKPGAAPGMPGYGTRCSTAIYFRGDVPDGEVRVLERSLAFDTKEWSDGDEIFRRVPAPPVPEAPNGGRREPDGTFLHSALDGGW